MDAEYPFLHGNYLVSAWSWITGSHNNSVALEEILEKSTNPLCLEVVKITHPLHVNAERYRVSLGKPN